VRIQVLALRHEHKVGARAHAPLLLLRPPGRRRRRRRARRRRQRRAARRAHRRRAGHAHRHRRRRQEGRPHARRRHACARGAASTPPGAGAGATAGSWHSEHARQALMRCAGMRPDHIFRAHTAMPVTHSGAGRGSAPGGMPNGGMPSGGRIGGGGSAPCGAPGRGGGGGRPCAAAPMGAGGSVDLSGALRFRSAARCSAIARICAPPCRAEPLSAARRRC